MPTEDVKSSSHSRDTENKGQFFSVRLHFESLQQQQRSLWAAKQGESFLTKKKHIKSDVTSLHQSVRETWVSFNPLDTPGWNTGCFFFLFSLSEVELTEFWVHCHTSCFLLDWLQFTRWAFVWRKRRMDKSLQCPVLCLWRLIVPYAVLLAPVMMRYSKKPLIKQATHTITVCCLLKTCKWSDALILLRLTLYKPLLV